MQRATDDYALHLSIARPVADLTTAQLDDARRVCGASKLNIRLTCGWESRDALEMLRPYSLRLDEINAEDARRQFQQSRQAALRRAGAPRTTNH